MISIKNLLPLSSNTYVMNNGRIGLISSRSQWRLCVVHDNLRCIGRSLCVVVEVVLLDELVLVSQLWHTVAMRTPRSNAKVIQMCRNEYQVRFLPDVMSVFLRTLESPAAQVASPDSTNISNKPSLQIRSLSAWPIL